MAAPAQKKSRMGLWITLGILGLFLVGGVSWYLYNFHAFILPVNLSEQEKKVVQQKVETIEAAGSGNTAATPKSTATPPDEALREAKQVKILTPEQEEKARQQERVDRRTIVLTQREINGMLNMNTDLGKRLKFDLKPGYIDIEYVQPIPEDIKIIGGQTWRFSMDVSMNKVPGRNLEFKLQDVSVGGIPLPAAWLEILGIRKNEDLMQMVKKELPIFEQLEKGIDFVDISSGQMQVRLAE
jgi:hypothetical protein